MLLYIRIVNKGFSLVRYMKVTFRREKYLLLINMGEADDNRKSFSRSPEGRT